MSDTSQAARGNRVLAALPADVFRRIVEQLSLVDLAARHSLYEANEPITDVYFPLTAVASLVVPMNDGGAFEAATVGNEGVVGWPVFLGVHSLPMRAFAQVPGRALQMDAGAFRTLLDEVDGPFARVLQRYGQTLFTQLAQNVACNRAHAVEQRAARWLLMTADRAGGPQFSLTQEFLAQMLGVRRASVTEVAGRLADAGMIRYTRGVVSIVERAQLEQVSCECYGVVAEIIERMLGARADETGAAADDDRSGVH